jgi:hypothetical protein
MKIEEIEGVGPTYIGEAAVTILSESGVPTPVVHTRLDPPRSRMGRTDDVVRSAKASPLYSKYGTRVDNQSARELLVRGVFGMLKKR